MSAVYSLSCAGNDGSILQIDFRRTGDRFVQSVRRLANDGTCLASWAGVQSSEPEQWPASPPIQELSLQSIDDRDVLLGVGRAGKCHWSVSVETGEIDTAPALRFDIACRCPDRPQWLGSTYRVERAEAGQGGPVTAVSALSIRCQEDATLGAGDAEQLRIEPIALPTRWPGTVRWRYAILGRGNAGSNDAPARTVPHG